MSEPNERDHEMAALVCREVAELPDRDACEHMTQVTREAEKRHSRARQEKYPEKKRAVQAVRTAINQGRLQRPHTCSRCGALDPRKQNGVTGIQAHHYNGYDNPLDVEWLCINCHAMEHKQQAGV